MRDVTKINKSVIPPVSIYVVYLSLGPRHGHKEPSQPSGVDIVPIYNITAISVYVRFAAARHPNLGSPARYTVGKNAAVRIIID
jgi:hypothetical protein